MLSSPSTNFDGSMYKFLYEIDLPMDVVFSVMKPAIVAKERLSWDKSLKNYEVVKKVNDESHIGVCTTWAVMMGMISSREFLDIYYYKTYDQDSLNADYGRISWVYARSVELPAERPVSTKVVRGKNYPAGFGIAENKKDPSKCYFELYVHTDVGGMLPKSLVEAGLPSQQVSYITAVCKEARKRLGKK